MRVTFTMIFFVNLLVMVAAVCYFSNSGNFSTKYFFIGLIASVFDSVGQACLQASYKHCPAGVSSSIASLSGVYLIVILAFRMDSMLSPPEVLALLFSLLGSLILVVPNKLTGLVLAAFGQEQVKPQIKMKVRDTEMLAR